MWRSTFAAFVLVLGSSPLWAQTPTPPAASPSAAATTPAIAASTKVPAKPAGRQCMRLPLSDIAVGRPETIAQAQLRLGEYAADEAKRRGWKGTLVKSDEKVDCEDYLYLPLIGQEYKCLVTATFCVGPATTAAAKPVARPVAKASAKAAVGADAKADAKSAGKTDAKAVTKAAPKPAPKPAN